MAETYFILSNKLNRKKKKHYLIPLLFILFIFFIISYYTSLIACAQEKELRKELVWYLDEKCYQDLDDIKADIEAGELIKVPEFFKELEILNVAVGDMDPDNAEYYWAAKPETLGMMLTIAGEYKKKLKDRNAVINVSGLMRTLEYQNILSEYTYWADQGRSTHTNGSTIDITVHPHYVKDVNKIDTLYAILKDLHEKEEIFFIDESGNSCFHVCINPEYREKYKNIFYEVEREYKISSYYKKNSTRFSPFKNEKELEDGVNKGSLILTDEVPADKLKIKLKFADNKSNFHYALRPEIIALLSEVYERAKELLNEDFTIVLSETVRTSEEQEKSDKEDPLLPENSPFIYGAAFRIDTKELSKEQIKAINYTINKMEKEGKVIFLSGEDDKIDVIMRPEKIPEYRLAYNKNFENEEKSSFKFDLTYLYITLALLGGFIVGFVLLNFSRFKMLIKAIRKTKRKKKTKLKKTKYIMPPLGD